MAEGPRPAFKPLPNGTKVLHTVARKRGVVHAQCTDPECVLVRYGKQTRPTVVPIHDLLVLK